eukprot:TRINITY_DN7426_c0_g1_i2.p1 TRINITY_DN7426_c0_g1~~TRINITY_DN7426_c0_g1_i2.p1  ORF type:complete len:505 (+),score=138.44 TRINITY_DN7426_c0_g1_i2:556-2070(+)
MEEEMITELAADVQKRENIFKNSQKQRKLRMSKPFEQTSWNIEEDDIEVLDRIGVGQFGEVFKGRLHGKEVAVKKLISVAVNEEVLEEFKREAAIMSNLHHPNILLFMGACCEPNNLMLVTELMPMGSLQDVLFENDMELSFKQRIHILTSVVLGMNWLHSLRPPFLHRDLKSGNVLLDSNLNVKIADFGMTSVRSLDENGDPYEGPVGSPFYMAPEVMLGKGSTPKSDVYSFSIIVWETLTGQEPYKDEFDSYESLVEGITFDETRPPLFDWIPKAMCELMEKCWANDPDERPSFSDIAQQGVFHKALIDHTIQDTYGASVWQQHFLAEGMVPWDSFCALALDTSLLSPDELRHAKRLLTAGGNAPIVSMESLSKMLNWFGPAHHSLTTPLKRASKLLSTGWFHASLTLMEAEYRVMKSGRVGAWLVCCDHVDAATRFFCLLVLSPSNTPLRIRVAQTFESITEDTDPLHSELLIEERPFASWHNIFAHYSLQEDAAVRADYE